MLYSVIASSTQFINSPSFPKNCSWLFVYGKSRQSPGWTRIQAELMTPDYLTDAMGGRRKSRILKINSHLLNISRPTVYIDTKRRIMNMDRVRDIIDAMKKCNASMLSFIHPDRPHHLIRELDEIITLKRTSNENEIRHQTGMVRGDPHLSSLDARGATTVNDGSMIVRIASPTLRAFERKWYRVYTTGGDRDQPAFSIAHARMFGDRASNMCGNVIWTIPHEGIRSLKVDGHDTFTSDHGAHIPKTGSPG